MMRDDDQMVSARAPNDGIERLAQPGGTLCHGIEHRLNISRRARDNAKDLGRGRLLFMCLRQALF
jgi:hypothetical protein